MIYFDNAATTRFKPQSVLDAVDFEIKCAVNPGRSGHSEAISGAIRQYQARENLKTLLGAGNGFHTIFTANCTEALNLAIFGLLLQETQKVDVITSCMEHNAVLRPLFKLASLGRVNVITLPPAENGKVSPNSIRAAITRQTKLVAVTHVSNVTGAVNDIHEIAAVCKAHNLPLLVDGAQAAGHTLVHLESLGADMYAGAAHKGIHGIQGAGFLCFKDNLKLQPIRYGGTGMASDSVLQPDIPPEAYEAGTANMPAIAALGAAAEWTGANLLKIEKHLTSIGRMLYDGLSEIKNIIIYSVKNSGIVTFNLAGLSSAELSNMLNEDGFALRGGLHCAPLMHRHLGTINMGALRASIGFTNSESEVKSLIEAVKNYAATSRQ